MFASGFSWFRLIPAVDKDQLLHTLGITDNSIAPGHETAETFVYLHAWLAVAVLIGFALLARAALTRAQKRQGIEKYFSDDKLTVLSLAEVFVGGMKGIMADLLDKKDARAFFPLIAGLFAYIFCCNIQSILPGFLPPTDNINTNAGMAIIVFLVFNYVGLSRDAAGYIKHLAGPALLLAPLMFPIEIVSLFIRPMSLSVRLTANLFGDHQVFTVMSGLVPWPLVYPAALLLLAILVSVVQSFVFSLLTVIYIHLSLPHHDEEHEHEAHAH
ncbi:MAG: F0F1 ATP synthase subunit A [Myxococcota bacterium]